MSTITRSLFRLAKGRLFGGAVRFGFAHLSALLPVSRVLDNELVIAFHHPKPAWVRHIVIVPKKAIATILDLGDPRNAKYLCAVFQAARQIIVSENLSQNEYFLCANGGSRQEVPQVHFHLAIGSDLVGELDEVNLANAEIINERDGIVSKSHHCDRWERHIVMIPLPDEPSLSGRLSAHESTYIKLIENLATLNRLFPLVHLGFTFLIQERSALEQNHLLAHVIAGKRLRSALLRA